MRGGRERERKTVEEEEEEEDDDDEESGGRCRCEAQQGPRTACSTCCASPEKMFAFHQISTEKTFDKVDHSRAAARLRSEKQV